VQTVFVLDLDCDVLVMVLFLDTRVLVRRCAYCITVLLFA